MAGPPPVCRWRIERPNRDRKVACERGLAAACAPQRPLQPEQLVGRHLSAKTIQASTHISADDPLVSLPRYLAARSLSA